MGQVTVILRKAYSGAVADMVAITPTDGDIFHATDTDALYIGHGGSWVHQPRNHVRRVAAVDFIANNFTHDSAWHVDGLDLTGIVPVGTVKVRMVIQVKATNAQAIFQLRPNAVDVENTGGPRTQVANAWTSYIEVTIPLDPDRLADYFTSLAGVDGGTRRVLITVVEWWT